MDFSMQPKGAKIKRCTPLRHFGFSVLCPPFFTIHVYFIIPHFTKKVNVFGHFFPKAQKTGDLHKASPVFVFSCQHSAAPGQNHRPAFSHPAGCRRRLRLVFFDIIYDIANGLDIFQIFVSNLYTEFFFYRHYQVY